MNTCKDVTQRLIEFRQERGWGKDHTPENLAKSIAIEAAELLQCFQWQESADAQHVKYEIADVLIYCLYLCHDLKLDPGKIVSEKIDLNANKYPISKKNNKQSSVTTKRKYLMSC